MKVLDDFFNNLKLPKQVVPNGSTIWENPTSTNVFDKIIHRRYYSLAEDQIDELEKTVNTIYHTQVVFPGWYQNFLKHNNGYDMFFGAIYFTGLQIINRTDPLHESPYSLYSGNLGKNKKLGKTVLLIGGYGFDRTRIAIETASNDSKIFCVYNETDKVICEWNSFEEFFVSETKRLKKLYDEKPWGSLDMGKETLPDGHKDKK